MEQHWHICVEKSCQQLRFVWSEAFLSLHRRWLPLAKDQLCIWIHNDPLEFTYWCIDAPVTIVLLIYRCWCSNANGYMHYISGAPYHTPYHYSDVIMSAMASQIARLTIACPTIYSGTDQRKHQSSASLAFVRGIHRWPVNSPYKWPVPRKMFPFDDVIV